MKRKLVVGVVVLAACPIAAFWMLVQFGLRHNDTDSVPRGWYWYAPGPVHRGDLVQACLPEDLAAFALDRAIAEPGNCPGGIAPMVKVLAGVYPDVVVVRDDAILINGKPWPMSASRTVDTDGHPLALRMQPGTYHVGLFQVLLLGLNPRSWDGRVYGLQPRSIVTGTWVPVPFITPTVKETV
jgi:conjugative transfer signal peptidase TraF